MYIHLFFYVLLGVKIFDLALKGACTGDDRILTVSLCFASSSPSGRQQLRLVATELDYVRDSVLEIRVAVVLLH